jgi:hypothetical protein
LSFRVFTFLLLLIASPLLLLAQRKNDDLNYHIKKTPTPILIDGVIDEAWLRAETADNFNMVLPMDTSKSLVKTAVK